MSHSTENKEREILPETLPPKSLEQSSTKLNLSSKHNSSLTAAEDIRPSMKAVKKRHRSFASGEIAAQIRRVSQQDLMETMNLAASKNSKATDNEKRKSTEGTNNKSLAASSKAVIAFGRFKRKNSHKMSFSTPNAMMTDSDAGSSDSIRRRSSRRASAPEIGTLGTALNHYIENPFAQYESTMFKPPPEADVIVHHSFDVCNLLFDILDSTEFEAFIMFMVMLLTLILLIGEYWYAMEGSDVLNAGLEYTSMIIVTIFLVEMLLKSATFGCAFLRIPSNVADTIFTSLAFAGQASQLATIGTSDYTPALGAFVRIALYLVVVLRQNRVWFFVQHLTTSWLEKKNKTDNDETKETTVQKSISILKKLRDNQSRGAQTLQIDWLIDVIASGVMYKKEEEYVEDSETRAFLEMQIGRQRSMGMDSRGSGNGLELIGGVEGGVENIQNDDGNSKGNSKGNVASDQLEQKSSIVDTLKKATSFKTETSSVSSVNDSPQISIRSNSSNLRSNSSNLRSKSRSRARRTTKFISTSTSAMRAPLSVRAIQLSSKNISAFATQLSVSDFAIYDNFYHIEKQVRDCNLHNEIGKWSCDIHEVSSVSKGHPLELVSSSLWKVLDIGAIEEVKENTFMKFMGIVQSNYSDEKTYHNSTHAADVTQTMSMFLRDRTVELILNSVDRFCAIVAAAIHDMGHPGTNNNFGMKTSSKWAIRYNDRSILENMHVSTAFKLMQDQPELNIFKEFSTELNREMRENIINMVLGTDMSFHFEDISHFQAQVMAPNADLNDLTVRRKVMRMCLHW